MNKQEIIERLSADEDRCKYCNSSTVSGGDIYCSASHSHDMDCDGKDFKLDYKIEEAISALEKQLTDMWIPISKRMPNHEEYCKNDGRFIVTDGNRVYQALFDIYDCKAFCNGGGKLWDLIIDTRPIAWQPLPELWKGDTQ